MPLSQSIPRSVLAINAHTKDEPSPALRRVRQPTRVMIGERGTGGSISDMLLPIRRSSRTFAILISTPLNKDIRIKI